MKKRRTKPNPRKQNHEYTRTHTISQISYYILMMFLGKKNECIYYLLSLAFDHSDVFAVFFSDGISKHTITRGKENC